MYWLISVEYWLILTKLENLINQYLNAAQQMLPICKYW